MTLNVFGASGSEAVLVEKMLGSSYEVVKFVADNIDQVRAISENVDEVVRIYASTDQIDAIAADLTALNELHGALTELLSVHAGIENIALIGDNIEGLLALQTHMTTLNAVYAALTPINSIAPHIAAINAIATSVAAVDLVATNMSDLQFIADNLAAVLSTIGGVDGIIDGRLASQAEAEAGVSTSKLSTPLRVAQYVSSLIGSSAGKIAAGNDSRITGAAQKDQNLNDLADKPQARTNLGLKNAATRDVGTIAGTVAAGDDSRFGAIPTLASQAEAEAGTDNAKFMSALRVKQSIAGKLDKAGGQVSGLLEAQLGLQISGSMTGSWSSSGWGTAAQLAQGQAIQWKKGSGTYSWNAGVSGDVFSVNRKDTDLLDGTGTPVTVLSVTAAGVISTPTYGNMGTYIDGRAASYASSAQSAAISSANSTALAYANQRVSSIALGGSWSGGSAPTGGVMTSASIANGGDGGTTFSGSGKYLYYYTPNTGWVVASAI